MGRNDGDYTCPVVASAANRSLSSLLALNVAALRAAIWIVSPVLGFRPWRAFLSFTTKLPNPRRSTRSPERKTLPISAKSESTTVSISAFGRSVAEATASINCGFVIPLQFNGLDLLFAHFWNPSRAKTRLGVHLASKSYGIKSFVFIEGSS